ncbi:carbohydrate kinase family protein [Rathayibacter sp. YIM 133350]|uniref:carbohydrate kinase family protein n=1 Tax=Rathayibacter sp. YIM 133350 TaxID=3131992 RepID=UPI00307D43D6
MSRVVIAGPASWNRIVYLDALPEPRPHMQFAEEYYDTVGGTSAGKALHLASLGHDVHLHTMLGDDDDGRRVGSLLADAGIDLHAIPADITERHLNLMTRAGERVSLYLETPHPVTSTAAPDFATADAVVLDLGAVSAGLLDTAAASGTPVWVDLHDYDGVSAYHDPFIGVADAVFMSDGGLEDPRPLMLRLIEGGASLVVCTLGAAGAIACDADGTFHSAAALPVEVRDTNGAGDAFLSGFLDAHLRAAPLTECLAAGARQARTALTTRHLHPALDDALGA